MRGITSSTSSEGGLGVPELELRDVPRIAALTQRVLLIDDDAALTRLVSEYLAGAGFAVERCAATRRGLARAAARRAQRSPLRSSDPRPDAARRRRARAVPAAARRRRPGARGAADRDARPRAERKPTASWASSSAPTTTSASPSIRASCWRGMRAVLRRGARGAPGGEAPLRFGRLEIDRAARVARVDGEERALTSHQFDLLVALAESAGRVLSREALMYAAARPRPRGLRPQHRRARVAHPRRARGRPGAAAPDPHRARRRLRVRAAQDEEPRPGAAGRGTSEPALPARLRRADRGGGGVLRELARCCSSGTAAARARMRCSAPPRRSRRCALRRARGAARSRARRVAELSTALGARRRALRRRGAAARRGRPLRAAARTSSAARATWRAVRATTRCCCGSPTAAGSRCACRRRRTVTAASSRASRCWPACSASRPGRSRAASRAASSR